MSTRDQLQLALAQSLMKQGGPAGSPLAIFGNLARQAAGLQLQRKALDDIEARKQAATQQVVQALQNRDNPAALLNAISDPDTPKTLASLGANVAASSYQKPEYKYVKTDGGVLIFQDGAEVGFSNTGDSSPIAARLSGRALRDQYGQEIQDRNLNSEYDVTFYPGTRRLKKISLSDRAYKVGPTGVVDVVAAAKSLGGQQAFQPEEVSEFSASATTQTTQANQPDISGLSGVSKIPFKAFEAAATLFGGQIEASRAVNILDRTNAAAKQFGASVPPSVLQAANQRLTDLVRNLEQIKQPEASVFQSDVAFKNAMTEYMSDINEVRKEYMTVLQNAAVGSNIRQNAQNSIVALTNILKSYDSLRKGIEGGSVDANQSKPLEKGESRGAVTRIK